MKTRLSHFRIHPFSDIYSQTCWSLLQNMNDTNLYVMLHEQAVSSILNLSLLSLSLSDQSGGGVDLSGCLCWLICRRSPYIGPQCCQLAGGEAGLARMRQTTTQVATLELNELCRVSYTHTHTHTRSCSSRIICHSTSMNNKLWPLWPVSVSV